VKIYGWSLGNTRAYSWRSTEEALEEYYAWWDSLYKRGYLAKEPQS
jgi:hypothetical protein